MLNHSKLIIHLYWQIPKFNQIENLVAIAMVIYMLDLKIHVIQKS